MVNPPTLKVHWPVSWADVDISVKELVPLVFAAVAAHSTQRSMPFFSSLLPQVTSSLGTVGPHAISVTQMELYRVDRMVQGLLAQWPDSWAAVDIAVKEMVPIFNVIWGKHWQGHHVFY